MMGSISGFNYEGNSAEVPVETINTNDEIKTTEGKSKPRPLSASVHSYETLSKDSTGKETKPSAKHPNYRSMVTAAIASKISRNGVSLRAINNYINSTYDVSSNLKFVNAQVKKVLTNMVDDGNAVLVTGTVGTGYFKLQSSQKSKTKKDSNVKADKTNETKPVPAESSQSTSDTLNSTFTKNSTSKSISKSKTKKVISSKRKSVLPKILKRTSILNRRKSVSKTSKKSNSKSNTKNSLKSVSKSKNIQSKSIPLVVTKSPTVKKLSKDTKAIKSKS